jgi:polyhydroxybutyrate depolymerase
MTGSALENPARDPRLVKAAGIAGLLTPVAWAAGAAVELAHANIGHSLISRPERFFSDSAWHLPLVLIVTVMAASQMAAGRALFAEAGLSRRLSRSAGLTFGLALSVRVMMAALLPSDPNGYTVSDAAALSANVLLVSTPLALLLAAVLVRRRSAGMAWLSAVVAIAMVSIALWATVWAARSGASQPQLLAIEPVEGLAAVWAALVGAWLLGRPASLASVLRSWTIPSPGRKSAVALAALLVVGVLGASMSFVNSFGPTIAAQVTGSTRVETITADTVVRTYRVHRPATLAAKPGLVVVLHGSFGGGFQAETTTGFDVEADRLGWIAVYPDGVADGWDAFGSGPTWGNHPGADDIVFIRQMIYVFLGRDHVDPDRIYVTGHSRGGMMSYRLGCELPNLVAAIAPVSGNMATASGSADVPCAPTNPVSVLAIHGTADGTIPMAGGRVDIIFSPMADVIARWRSLNTCADTSTVAVDGSTTTTAWACAGGSTVETRIQAGGCHCWTSDDSRAIADFFVAHPRVRAGG